MASWIGQALDVFGHLMTLTITQPAPGLILIGKMRKQERLINQ